MFAWLRKGDRLETALGVFAWIAIIAGIYEFHHIPTAAEIKKEQADAEEAKLQQARADAIFKLAEHCEQVNSVTYECLKAEHDADEMAEDAKAEQ